MTRCWRGWHRRRPAYDPRFDRTAAIGRRAEVHSTRVSQGYVSSQKATEADAAALIAGSDGDGQCSAILIPIDHYSPHTDSAVAAAVELVKLTGAAIHIVHAEEGVSGIDSLALGPLPADTASKMRQEDIDLLEDARHRFADAGLSAATELVPRDGTSIYKRVLGAAERVGADLIRLGAGGSSELVGLLLGSVSYKIIRHAPSAVLVIR